MPSSVTFDQIREAAVIGEGVDWEFKSARGGLPGDLWETYSAFANTEGGVIVLGAREQPDGSINLDGLSEDRALQYQRDLWNTLNNRGKVNHNLCRDEDLKLHPMGDGFLLSLHVPTAGRAQKPVYLNGSPLGNTFKRRHEGDYHCSDSEVRRMFADADDQTPADYRILEGFTLDDLDQASLTQYRQRFRAAKGDHPWLALENRELLEKLQGWRRDRNSGREGLTLAGLLMFGKGDVIKDPDAAPNFFPDYREKLDPSIRWTDRIYPDGTWEGNLFQFYQRVWPKLSSGLPTPFQLEAGMRRDETPAHKALREAFVNALIHADYNCPGGTVIERYPDQFVIENPGTLLVSFDQYRRGGASECRNKGLQQMFLMIGGGERAGSGVDTILKGWRSRHWRTPLMKRQSEPDRVMLILPMVSLIPDETIRALEERFGKEVVEGLSPAELQALATALIEDSVTNVRLRELLDEHPVDITRLLQGLCDRGLLASDNRRRWTTYRLNGAKNTESDLFSSASKESLQQSSGDSQQLPGDSQQLPGDSQQLPGDSQQRGVGGQGGILSTISPEERARLEAIADPIASKAKATAEETQRVIEELCQGRFLNSAEIAQLLNRSKGAVQQRFLNAMIKEGSLRYRFAGAANRPDQAYTSAKTPATE
jgi:ATP-dependent DNA helicase RecG